MDGEEGKIWNEKKDSPTIKNKTIFSRIHIAERYYCTKSLQDKTYFSVNSFPTPSYILAPLRATLTFVPLSSSSSSFFFSFLFCLFCLFFCLFARKCAQQ